jgi:hypothetical protein
MQRPPATSPPHRANAAGCRTPQADLTGGLENIDDFSACKITSK